MTYAKFGGENLKLDLEGISLVGYILESNQYVITLDSLQSAMDTQKSGSLWAYDFAIYLSQFFQVSNDLIDELKDPNTFAHYDTAGTMNIQTGYSPSVLRAFLEIIKEAKNRGFLYRSELKISKVAETILRLTENANLYPLIDYSTGYDLYKANHKRKLSHYLTKRFGNACFSWIKTFPDSFFEDIFEFFDIEWDDLNKRSEISGKLINDLVFSRIEPDLLNRLASTRPKMKYGKGNKQEKYLEDPVMMKHLISVSSLLNIADSNEAIFYQLLNKTHPVVNDFDFTTLENPPSILDSDLNILSEILVPGIKKIRAV